jgi:hypothetical protein
VSKAFSKSINSKRPGISSSSKTTGVKINDSEYLLSQYPDDSSLILDDNPKSLDQSLFMFNTFSECAGLRVNFDKTEATWLGSRRNCHEQLLPDVFNCSTQEF